jgi:hypothetical protein
MSDPHAHHTHAHQNAARDQRGVTRLAISATLHCLTGCSIGEVLGLVLASWWGWGTAASIALAVGLAFVFGYSLTILPLLRAKISPLRAAGLALASDTASITAMEIVDNAVMLITPGAMGAGLASPLFWITMAIALALGGLAAFPVNRFLIARGRGHAVLHEHHKH